MKKIIFAALAVTIAATSPALAIKRSTAKKYINTSDIIQVKGCEVESVKRFTQYVTKNGRTKKKEHDHHFHVKIECPIDGSPFTHTFKYDALRTDLLFGIGVDGKVNHHHPISVAYRNKKGW